MKSQPSDTPVALLTFSPDDGKESAREHFERLLDEAVGDDAATFADDSEGRWITIAGAHVFIKDGKIEKGPAALVGKSPGEAAKSPTPSRSLKPAGAAHGQEFFHNPITRSDRPYQYPGLKVITGAQNDPTYPVEHLDPETLHSTQATVTKERVEKIDGPIKAPIIVVRHDGKDYIEEGNHRAVAAWKRGEKVPAKIIEVNAKKPVKSAGFAGTAGGKPLSWTPAEIEKLATVTDEDLARAARRWRELAPDPMKKLLGTGTKAKE